MEPCADIRRKLDRARIAQNLDGFLGLVHNHGAVFTVVQMAFQLGLQTGIEIPVDVVGQLADNTFAIQLSVPRRK